MTSSQPLLFASSPPNFDQQQTPMRPQSSNPSRQANRKAFNSSDLAVGPNNMNSNQFMFQGADGSRPKRVRPTTAASNTKLLQKSYDSRNRGRDTFFSSQMDPSRDETQSPRCSRERCRDLIKQQLLLKQMTKARRGIGQNAIAAQAAIQYHQQNTPKRIG